MAKLHLPTPASAFLIALIIWSSDYATCNAQNDDRHRKISTTSLKNKGKGGESSVFSVLDYGAMGDGTIDDTKAFEEAWAAACKVESSTLVAPLGFRFLVKPVAFSGSSCASNVNFQLDGTITAPKKLSDFQSGLSQWIKFTKLKGFTIKGGGTIDGQGQVWWDETTSEKPVVSTKAMFGSLGEINTRLGEFALFNLNAIRITGSSGVGVTGITIKNSPRFHLTFDDCVDVRVFSMSNSSPADSPNTDGIHLHNCQNVAINNVSLACGDDCISIQTGTSNVYIHDVNCGPGHGISIGGLGKDRTKACVSNITVRNVVIRNTTTGVRIKTWQGGSGSVQGVTFSNIQVSEVQTPIVIDQYYCDKRKCDNATSAVAVSRISYNNIRGTYTREPIHLACSDSKPCEDIVLSNIELRPANDNKEGPFCWKAYGKVKTDTIPALDHCLDNEENSSYKVQSKSYSC